MYKRLGKFLEYQQNIEMIYLSNDNKISKRIVKLYSVTEESVTGYCYLRGNVRTFKTEQILAILPSENDRMKETELNKKKKLRRFPSEAF